ncbi:CDP-glycerol glycerophosphotransferase family protein [Rahnella inusitata]|uniref:CDP-glycerol glycerophosphotransferase family protein n=1 Tax=Rahnella inusitata TaxID=58169 RepID=UPI0039BE01F1
MSRATKLLTQPNLFFKDMYKKRFQRPSTPTANTSQQKKVNAVTVKKEYSTQPNKSANAASKVTPSLIIDNMRLFTKISHLLHTGEGVRCAYQLEQWVGEFIASGEKFAILTRNIEMYKWAIQQYPYLDIVYAKAAIDVENMLNKLPYLKGIYYFSNTGNLIHTLRYNVYQHIFLGHGDSDKAASAHKYFRVYDEIWVAGQAHIDRFKNAKFNIGHLTFIKVGRPTLKQIVKKSVNNLNSPKNIKSLTYFPTWEGVYEENNYSSAHLSVVMLPEIQSRLECNIFAKYHPLTSSRDKTLATISDALSQSFIEKPFMLEIADKTVPVEKLIVNSDLFICDISAVVSECISSLCPIFIYIPADRNIVTSSSEMQYSDYAYEFSSIPQLMSLIETVLIEGNDYLAEARYKALDYLLSINETVNNEFINQLKRIGADNSLQENVREQITQ